MTNTKMKAGVDRLLTDLYWLRTELKAVGKLADKDHVGFDFFKVVHTALVADFQHRLGRVLDRHPDAFSFWTIHREKGADVERVLSAHGLPLASISQLANRFKSIRDEILAHTDKRGPLDRDQLYKSANIKGLEIHTVADALWNTLCDLYPGWFGKTAPRGDEYSGDDIEEIHRRYMSWRYPGGETARSPRSTPASPPAGVPEMGGADVTGGNQGQDQRKASGRNPAS